MTDPNLGNVKGHNCWVALIKPDIIGMPWCGGNTDKPDKRRRRYTMQWHDSASLLHPPDKVPGGQVHILEHAIYRGASKGCVALVALNDSQRTIRRHSLCGDIRRESGALGDVDVCRTQ
jgi:hypothetical protein